MSAALPLVVFSDLDGTLLDHDTYDWRPAKSALDRLAALGVPVVLASSKTAAEIAPLQAEMGLSDWPAIVENGAGLLGQQSPPTYDRLREALTQIPADLRARFRGFGDMDAEGVAACTGLPIAKAADAQARQFSEPGLWSGSEAEQAAFVAALARHGVAARHGGRFLTLSFGKTKADQMADIVARFRPAQTVALGDAPNDTEMLETADIGIVIANPHRPALPPLTGERDGRIIRTLMAGPSGWNAAMMDLLDRLGL